MSPARMIRADMLREQGRTRQVTAEYRAVIERRPHLPWPWFGLSNLKNVPMTADDIKSIRSALLAHPDSGDERTALQFALAKALDDNALYAEAFAALEQANREVRLRVEWNEVKSSAQMDALLAAFASSSSSAGVARGREVIFIVNLPRSGSTLVEQILASHQQVEGAGEEGDWISAGTVAFSNNVANNNGVGFFAVALGAFGAHGLADPVSHEPSRTVRAKAKHSPEL